MTAACLSEPAPDCCGAFYALSSLCAHTAAVGQLNNYMVLVPLNLLAQAPRQVRSSRGIFCPGKGALVVRLMPGFAAGSARFVLARAAARLAGLPAFSLQHPALLPLVAIFSPSLDGPAWRAVGAAAGGHWPAQLLTACTTNEWPPCRRATLGYGPLCGYSRAVGSACCLWSPCHIARPRITPIEPCKFSWRETKCKHGGHEVHTWCVACHCPATLS